MLGAPATSFSASPAVEVTKHSWRGRYARLLRLTDSGVCTLDPSDHRITNRWDVMDILSVSQRDHGVLLRLAGGGSLCGGAVSTLHFSLPTVAAASALQSAIQRRLVRHLARDSEEGHTWLHPRQGAALASQSEPVVFVGEDSADWSLDAPSRFSSEALPPSPPKGTLAFDVHVTINKARNLPVHSFLWPNAVVQCVWGAAGEASETPSVCSSTVGTPTPPRRATIATQSTPALQSSRSPLGDASQVERVSAEDIEQATHVGGAPVRFETGEGGPERSNPRWSHEVSFIYSSTEQQLRSRFFELRVVRLRWMLPPLLVGSCRVRLDKIASGPNKYDLPLHRQGLEQGRLVFTVHMVQQCRLTVELPKISCVMRSLAHHTSLASQEATLRESCYSLTAGLTVEAVEESMPAHAEFDVGTLDAKDMSQVNMSLPASAALKLVAETTAKAFENESLHLCVWVSNKEGARRERMVGEVWLPITKVFSPKSGAADSSIERFSEVLWLNGQRVGRLNGTVVVYNGPKVVQLPGGFFTERGILPVGPLAVGLVPKGGKNNKAASVAEDGDPSLEFSQPNADMDVEKPTGLKIPKEVEWLLSLVQSLKKVILDLHLDPKSHPDAPLERETEERIKGSASSAFLNLHAEKYANDRDGNNAAMEWHGRHEMASRRLQFLLSRLQMLLGLSSKESTKAFFYCSSEALQWTQRLMLRLWSYLLSQVDHVVYRHQPLFLETLHQLMLRGEFDWSAFMDAPSSLLWRYQRTLWDTTGYVIGKLNRKAAPAEVRAFCSQALSICFFRLPTLRDVLLETILPHGENRHKHVREWNLPWSLQKSALAEVSHAQGARGGARVQQRSPTLAEALRSTVEAVTKLSVPVHSAGPSREGSKHIVHDGNARSLSPAVAADAQRHVSMASSVFEKLGATNGGRSVEVNGVAHVGESDADTTGEGEYVSMLQKRADRWAKLWSAHSEDAAMVERRVERALAGKYWRDRLRKRGHCFFLLLEHWMRHVPTAMGWQPGEAVAWKEVPGYPRMIKSLLLEMKQRPVLHWSESMVSCICTVVQEDRRLIQVVVRVLLGRVNAQPRVMQKVLKYLSAIFGVLPADPPAQTMTNDLLLQHLKLMVEADHFKVVGCALIFVYNHIDQLGELARLEMLQWLHARFGALALHWSRVVRSIYMHVVVIKVLHYEVPVKAKSNTSLDMLLASTPRSEPFVDRSNGLRKSSKSWSSLQARSLSLSNISAATQREADYADLRESYQASLDLLEQAAERMLPSDMYPALFLSAEPSHGYAACIKAYAPYAWQEYRQVMKKWSALAVEIEAARESGEATTIARNLSCNSISSISSNGSHASHGFNGSGTLNGHNNYGNGHSNGAGVGASPLLGGMQQAAPLCNSWNGEPSRVVRQLSLSMHLISDDITEDDDLANADEW
ncbi:hypothetical protein AB1Y20_023643 [Prymnesium parvum]|uniref:DnaJ homologue subfamily C GRV2/DNAJC13 N-terminal domain-containing protein n=1 Tax=Prymnesium parvum TaxID=97485 RepID=A0AB34JFB9_PRYPA